MLLQTDLIETTESLLWPTGKVVIAIVIAILVHFILFFILV